MDPLTPTDCSSKQALLCFLSFWAFLSFVAGAEPRFAISLPSHPEEGKGESDSPLSPWRWLGRDPGLATGVVVWRWPRSLDKTSTRNACG